MLPGSAFIHINHRLLFLLSWYQSTRPLLGSTFSHIKASHYVWKSCNPWLDMQKPRIDFRWKPWVVFLCYGNSCLMGQPALEIHHLTWEKSAISWHSYMTRNLLCTTNMFWPFAILTNYNAMGVEKRQASIVYNDDNNLHLQFDKIQAGSGDFYCFWSVSSSKPSPLAYLLFTFILSNMIFFYKEGLLQRSRDAEQLLVWVYCS